jgi:CheY-like chemotaxis protein
MKTRRARILVIDDARGTLSNALDGALSHHNVDFAGDAFDAIYRIDRAARPYDMIFCDLASGDVPGPELWAYLSLSRKSAASRMVFVASAALSLEATAFLERVPNLCFELPVDPDAFDALARRRVAMVRRPTWTTTLAELQPRQE